MQRLLSLAATFLIGSAAFAQVEPRVAGDWRCGEESLHIGADGRYQKSTNGQVTESGMISANNGSWTLKSDTGRTDVGSFSFLAGKLTMHGSISGSWTPLTSHPAVTQASPSHSFSTPIHTTNSAAPSNTAKFNSPPSAKNYNSPVAEHQDYNPPQSTQPYTPPSNYWSSQPISTSPDPQVRTAPPSFSNSQPLPAFPNARPFKPLMYVPGAPTYPPGYKPLVGPRPASVNPPGWRPPADHPNDRGPNQDSNGNWVERNHPKPGSAQYTYAADAKPNGRPGDLSSFEQNAAAQWQQRGQSPGYQRVPQGGYIPVMKDNKARSFWRGF